MLKCEMLGAFTIIKFIKKYTCLKANYLVKKHIVRAEDMVYNTESS